MLEWHNQKPDKNGLWLTRIPNHAGIGVYVVKGTEIYNVDCIMTYEEPYNHWPIDVWWHDDDFTLTYYVGPYEDFGVEVMCKTHSYLP